MVGPSKWKPTDLPAGALIAWWDYSDVSTITKDGSNNVTRVKDKSGNRYDLIRSGGGTATLIYNPTGGPDGKGSLTTGGNTGCGNYFKAAVPPGTFPNGILMMSIWRHTGIIGDGGCGPLTRNGGGGKDGVPEVGAFTDTRVCGDTSFNWAATNGWPNLYSDARTHNTWNLMEHEAIVGGLFHERINGVTTAKTLSMSTYSDLATGIDVGNSWVDNTTSEHSEEVVVRPDLLGTGDLDRLQGYLMHRRALSSLIPSGHTYKAAAPTVLRTPKATCRLSNVNGRDKSQYVTISRNGTHVVGSNGTGAHVGARATRPGIGKFHFEVGLPYKYASGDALGIIGVSNTSVGLSTFSTLGNNANSFALTMHWGGWELVYNGTIVASGSADIRGGPATDMIVWEVDTVAGTASCYGRFGTGASFTLLGTITGLALDSYYPTVLVCDDDLEVDVNFGATPFQMTPSAGYKAIVNTAPALWTPASLGSKLRLWLSGDTLSGSANDPVSAWGDQSGRGKDATSSGSNRPTLQPATLNGLPVVRFNAVAQQSMAFPTDLLTGDTKGQAFFVAKVSGSIGSGPILGDWGTDSQSNHYPYADGVIYEDFMCNPRRTVGNPGNLQTWHMGSFASNAGGLWEYWNNASRFYSNTAGGVGIGSAPKLGCSDGSMFWDGDLAEVLYFNDVLNDIERQYVEGYLAWKWGKQDLLPATHLFATSPPMEPRCTDAQTNFVNYGPTTINFDMAVAAGKNIVLISVTDMPATSVTVGGVSATKIYESDTANPNFSMWQFDSYVDAVQKVTISYAYNMAVAAAVYHMDAAGALVEAASGTIPGDRGLPMYSERGSIMFPPGGMGIALYGLNNGGNYNNLNGATPWNNGVADFNLNPNTNAGYGSVFSGAHFAVPSDIPNFGNHAFSGKPMIYLGWQPWNYTAPTITLIGRAHVDGNGAASGGTTAAIDTTGADFLLMNMSRFSGSSGLTVSDSKGNTWTAGTFLSGQDGNPGTQIFYCTNPIVGTGHTFTFDGSALYGNITVTAWKGVDQTSPIDSTQAWAATNDTASPTVTPSMDGCAMVSLHFGAAQGLLRWTSNAEFGVAWTHPANWGSNYSHAFSYSIQPVAAARAAKWKWDSAPGNSFSSSMTVLKPAATSSGSSAPVTSSSFI